MFCDFFIIVGVAGLESNKIARKLSIMHLIAIPWIAK